MTQTNHPLSCEVKTLNSQFCQVIITIPHEYVDAIYREIADAQKERVDTHGFTKGNTPIGYIQEHYKSNLIEHVKEFLFKYFVINYLYEQLHEKKMFTSGEPRLTDITVNDEHEIEFHFEVSLANSIDFREWKSFPFKAPKRKNYKDIDRQVESFIKDEQQRAKDTQTDTIQSGDWVCFDLFLNNKKGKALLSSHPQNVWLKIGDEDVDIPFQELFLNKQVGDSFSTNDTILQEYFSHQIDTHYTFGLTIEEVVKNSYFSFDDFKGHFRLKNNKEVHQKLIEIFSYRNDLSQRRSIIEETLKLLIQKHHVEVPNYLILRQQKIVLESVQDNPDYQVYKMEPNFKETIQQLATKQVKEMILIDQLTHKENVVITNKDIKAYLNLMKRPRTKEFIYFNTPPTKIEGQEMPIPTGLLQRNCLREKTLNYIIYHLTRK